MTGVNTLAISGNPAMLGKQSGKEAIPAKFISMETTTLYNIATLTSCQNQPNWLLL